MNDSGISSKEYDVHLFRTTDTQWRVMSFGDSGEEGDYPETYYWNESLKEAMKTFGRMTARRPERTISEFLRNVPQVTSEYYNSVLQLCKELTRIQHHEIKTKNPREVTRKDHFRTLNP